MIAFEAEDSPINTGRPSRKNAKAPKIIARLEPWKIPSGPLEIEVSITAPRIQAVPASSPPASADKTAASHSAGQAPLRHQRMNAPSVCGGGPSAGSNGVIRSSNFIPPPRFRD